MSSRPILVAIDGPAASGKGTLARRLAAHFGLRHLDTGLTYRAVAEALMRAGIDLDDERAALDAASAGLDFSRLDRRLLSGHQIGEAASRVAIMPALRRVLVEKQRAFAHEPPGAVLDGRDIGTIVLPDAAAKLFVTASAQTRARRRSLELREQGGKIRQKDVLADIRKRDARDMGRSDSPLRPASGAYLLDTTDLDIEAAFRAAVDYVSGKIAI